MKGWGVWITGLPGSGKTVTAKEFLKQLKKKKIQAEYLRMDEIRKVLTPKRKYNGEERDYAYRSLVLIAKFLTDNEVNVVIDATGHRDVWRKLARRLMPKFLEVYLKCPLNLCMDRESKRKDNLILSNLYEKAKRRMGDGVIIDGLGEVIGVNVEYEEPRKPDLVIESDKLGLKESADEILKLLKSKRWV
jgi:adenylylsulfate kinase